MVAAPEIDLDLFAGPGGWDEGGLRLGLRPVGIEWDDAACRTAVAAGHLRIRADVATYPTGHLRGKIRGLIASPPCQAWSMAVSMASALGWGATARPIPTVTAGGTASGGGPAPLARGGRDALTREREREEVGSIGYRLHRGAGMNERHGSRADRPADLPAPVITSKARTAAWVVDRRTNSEAAGGGRTPTVPVPITEPAPTFTSKSGTQWVVRPEAPAWTHDRPATTIVGSFAPDVVAAPGYRLTESRQQAEASVQVTVAEASVLQSFRRDYPWQGSRSKQFEQVGNAVPPLLAAHVLSAATGIPLNGEVAA